MTKLKNTTHYICDKCADYDIKLDFIKLNKILLHVDLLTFTKTGKSLTGATYIKKKFGPAVR